MFFIVARPISVRLHLWYPFKIIKVCVLRTERTDLNTQYVLHLSYKRV